MNILKEVYTEFANRFSGMGEVVIAGGAVRDYLMKKDAKDYDVFVLTTETDEKRKQIFDATSDLESAVEIVPWARSMPADQESALIRSVIWNGAEIQILINPVMTPRALIETFDWNVCYFAYSSEGFTEGEDLHNMNPGGTLMLMRDTTPLSTLRRGFRFSERFKLKIDMEDIKTLCQKILEKYQ